jgi:hypothetical protein
LFRKVRGVVVVTRVCETVLVGNALGDRSNLTFPSGELVYDEDLGNDGEYQILIQPADAASPSNWTSNWLPAPAGGGKVVPQLRFYGAETPLTDGSYVYPTIQKIAAVRRPERSSGSGNGAPPETDGAAGLSPISETSIVIISALLTWNLLL